jgi:hypothetical protein
MVEPTTIDTNWKALGALDRVDGENELAVRIESKPEPMYATDGDDGFVFWSFDYSTRCQTREDPEDAFCGFPSVVDLVHACANDDYGIDVVDRSEIDTEPKPTATSIDDFDDQGEA